MPKTKRVQIAAWFLPAEAGVAAACALAAAITILFPGTPAEQILFWNISAPRLMLAAAPLAIFTAAVAVLARALLGQRETPGVAVRVIEAGRDRRFVRWAAWVLVSAGVVGLLVPAGQFGEWADYYARLRPLLVWVVTLGVQLLTVIASARADRTRADLAAWVSRLRPLATPTAWIMLTIIVLGVVMAAVIHGIRTYEDYRYEPGVPILPLQIAVAVLAGIVFQRTVEPRISRAARTTDLVIFVLLWALAAAYWASIPAPSSYMNPAPLPPNDVMYPFSDAAGYDLQAQSALLGLGLDGGRAVENPIYSTVLTLLHLLGGQDFEVNMRLQAALLAVLPALAFLLGKRLQGRGLGISAACMLGFHGANTIVAAGLINTASPKQILTDYPAAIGVALVMLSALQLADRNSDVLRASIWHGASAAFAYMIRPTGLVLLAAAPIAAWLRERSISGWLRVMLLSLGASALFFLPWAIRNGVRDERALTEYLSKFSLITRTRYVDVQRGAPNDIPAGQHDGESAYGTNDQSRRQAGEPLPRREPQMDAWSVAAAMSFHFANNVMASALILPTSPVLSDLRQELRADGSLWRRPWNGTLGFWQMVWLALSAGVLAAGGVALWTKNRAIAAIPLAVFLVYQVANSIARTSGGRYVVPVDWVLFLYLAAGLLVTFDPGLVAGEPKARRTSAKASVGRRGWIAAAAGIVLLGATPVLVEAAVPQRFTQEQVSAESVDASARDFLLRAGYDEGEVNAYMTGGLSRRLFGRAYYPRLFSQRAIRNAAEGGLAGLTFPRLQFSLVGADGLQRDVFMFTASQLPLAHATDVLVLGCREPETRYIEALVVVDLSTSTKPVLISDRKELTCGLPRPVCEAGGICE